MLLNNQWVKNEIGKKSKSFWKQTKINSQQFKPMRNSKGSREREVHSDTGLPKKDRNISNKQPNHPPTRTQRTTKTASSTNGVGRARQLHAKK